MQQWKLGKIIEAKIKYFNLFLRWGNKAFSGSFCVSDNSSRFIWQEGHNIWIGFFVMAFIKM